MNRFSNNLFQQRSSRPYFYYNVTRSVMSSTSYFRSLFCFLPWKRSDHFCLKTPPKKKETAKNLYRGHFTKQVDWSATFCFAPCKCVRVCVSMFSLRKCLFLSPSVGWFGANFRTSRMSDDDQPASQPHIWCVSLKYRCFWLVGRSVVDSSALVWDNFGGFERRLRWKWAFNEDRRHAESVCFAK